jgi:hypothetical protein
MKTFTWPAGPGTAQSGHVIGDVLLCGETGALGLAGHIALQHPHRTQSRNRRVTAGGDDGIGQCLPAAPAGSAATADVWVCAAIS